MQRRLRVSRSNACAVTSVSPLVHESDSGSKEESDPEHSKRLAGGTSMPSHGFQTIFLQAVKQKPPSHLCLTHHTHTESFLCPGGQVETNVCNRNLSLKNKRLIQIVVSGTQQKVLRPSGIRYVVTVKNSSFGNFERAPTQLLSCVRGCQPQESVCFHWRRIPTTYSTE